MKIALVYDWIHTFGGAERVLLALHDLFPEAPLFTAIHNPQDTAWADCFRIKSSFLNSVPLSKTHHELFPLLTPIAFENFDFSNFDIIISVTSSDAKGIITKPKTLHICYMLTPTRYLWSHENSYFSNKLFKFLAIQGINYLKNWDLVAKTRPDYIIAISKTVQARIKSYYNRESEVIYPPVSLPFAKSLKQRGKSDYFLVVSRLVPYKRIDLAIQACAKLNLPLVIIGEGRAKTKLEKYTGKTTSFVSNLTDAALIGYYQNCRAVIMTAEEDFGIVSVEAQAAGKPVIALGQGGASETVRDGRTGILFDKQDVKSLIEALIRFNKTHFSSKECFKNSQLFTEKMFKEQFMKKFLRYKDEYFKER